MQVDMDKIYARAVKLVTENKNNKTIDLHWEVCNTLCFEFMEEVENFPMWLMYVVSGIMREEGVSC